MKALGYFVSHYGFGATNTAGAFVLNRLWLRPVLHQGARLFQAGSSIIPSLDKSSVPWDVLFLVLFCFFQQQQ
ncbi:hypothetical protein [Pseudomonas chlororaphis]|uniref:hypothetical protein n=1 Tax=Pseudomonas chlororaphis TaxID=587753 RepID=UPI0012FD5197|nr:hypothetical protein [Pseudomonas chlororaphis]